MSINDMYENTQSSFIANSPTLETQMPINRRIGAQTVVHPRHGILRGNEKSKLSAHSVMWMSRTDIELKVPTHYMLLFMRFKKR